jgi:aminotransferase
MPADLRHHRRHGAHPSVHHHVRADHGTGCRHRSLENGEPYVQEMVTEYDRRRRLLVAGLNRLGLSTFEPKGAFYAFPNIRASGMDDETFAEKLLREESVAVVPGNAFGPGGDGFVRACYATSYEKIEEALRRMERFMSRYG